MANSKGTTEEVQLVTADSTDGHKKPIAANTVVLRRVDNSFGFTLRHFVVYPPEVIKSRSPNEVGSEHKRPHPIDTVFVRQVSPGGPADKAGLSSGDQVVSVNGLQVVNKSYHQVIEMIQKSQDSVELGIVPKEECVLQMVSPVISESPPSKSIHPPPTKTKPNRDKTEQTNVMSTITIASTPPSDSHLKNSSLTVNLSNKPVDTPAQPIVTRRSSIDKTAQGNRAYVVSSSNKEDEMNNNSNSTVQKGTGSHGSHGNSPNQFGGGTYFFAATDSTGKPRALHFQRGSNVGDSLTVVERTKTRSRSLPAVEMEGIQSWEERRRRQQNLSHQNGPQISINQNSLQINIGEPQGKTPVSNGIPHYVVSSPRIVASDGPSTVNVSTNSEFMSRQPVAREPRKTSNEESTSYLVRTIASHVNHDRSGGLQTSTMGATLLESRPEPMESIYSGSNVDEYSDGPHPPKHPRHSNSDNPPYVVSSEVSVFPNQANNEEIQLSISNESGDHFSISQNQLTFEDRRAKQEGTSPRQRRTSYLMATSASGKAPVSKPLSATHGIPKKTPTLSSALSSGFMTPMMVHVSSGTEICEDTPKGQGQGLPIDEDDDEIFVEGDTGTDDSLAPRIGRRISYVMATSSPSTSKTPHITLEEMKEEGEDEHHMEAVPGMMETIKEGFLWKKLVVGGGGKRSSVRSWKPVYVVLRGHVLYFYKDREAARLTKMGDGGDDQQPISIKSSIVDIAHDYTKRKNVFRMTLFNGCEYLFQCEDRSSMMKWIEAIQANNNPDDDESGVTSQSLIIRRMRNVEQESTGTTHNTSHKLTPAGSSAKMPNFSNLKKSLSFKNISGIQKGESNKNNQWHKKKRKKQSPNITNFVPGHSIGVPLELCPCSKVNKCVPILVEHCCEVVDLKGLDNVGVYRVPGNSAAVSLLHDEINTRGAENINFEEEKWHDVNNITSLLKQFLRKLPEGLITAELYEPFIEANKKEDPVERMWALKCLINDLPEHNYETLKYLLAHLKRVSDNTEKNKMEARNLAIVFGPTLVRTGEDTMISMVKDMSDQCRIVETLLTHNEWFFEEGGDGDDPPPKPPVNEEGQEHFVSMSVLSSLGQAAGNFDDGNMKSKSGGLAHISLHIPKFRGKHKSESHDSSSPEALTSDGSVSPTLDRVPPRISGTGSCPGSPTQERHKFAAKKSADLSSLSTGSMANVIEVVDADSKSRGTSSLKAYSYARPPPPSYRKVGPQRMPASPSGDHHQDPVPIYVTFGHPGVESNETTNKAEMEVAQDMDNTGHPSRPTFASLSEETRLRLLKVSLQQKALEKRRQSEGNVGVTHFQADVNEELPHESLLAPPKNTDHDVSDSTEHLSSSNTSRSSSSPSSKTASLDSLHLPSGSPSDGDGRKNIGSYPGTRVTSSGGWKASLSSPHLSTPPVNTQSVDSTATSQTSKTSCETVVTIVQGKGVVSNNSEAKRRPSSSDIRARRNTAEGLRVRPTMQSESSDSSSEDEGDLALSMSKTFDEKLRILLDLDYSFKGQSQKKAEEEDSSSVSSERPRKISTEKQLRQSDERSDRESYEDVRGSNSSLALSTPERRSSTENRHSEPRRFSSDSTHVQGSETRTSIQIETKQRKGSAEKVIPMKSPSRNADRRPSSTQETTKTVISVGNTKGDKRQDKVLPSERVSKMGRVQTATPVALKEFKINGSKFKKDQRSVGRREVYSTPNQSARVDSGLSKRVVHKDSPIVKARTEESSITINQSPRNSIGSSRGSFSDSPRSSVTDSSPRNSRSEVNINLSRSPKPAGPAEKAPGKYAAMAARSHVPPKVMNREPAAPKPKTYPNRDNSGRAILPSRTRHGGTSKEPTREKHAHKLETNAQHIAELLEEMHSERYLKMTRQRSDISGQAQKAAAQRSASRRRRRSLGDENNEMQKQLEPNEKLYSGRV
ncbi:uncharacterized protein LOC116293222 isoform X2 [Actinia tenebrosa]|uniref:Uncharacterized protein LOC116293222 isoform X2 n=1 Tax=Actinia tenebrosa TaxID=6105 RepID=A0A6P8HL51_ACTTE|nr:uncharacterized protein LOC116293222 isoform X2 [Actinia tenebrosa]